MTPFEAILYGVVQGFTEWLPISSTAHLRILPALLGKPDPGAGFTAVIQLGTMLAVLIFFWRDLGRSGKAWFRSLRGIDKDSDDAKLAWAVFYGSIPIMLIGYALRHQISSPQVRSLNVIGVTLIVMGVVMLFAERYNAKNQKPRAVTVKDGVLIGFWQALSLIPGMSRSGSTISGGLFAGLDRYTAARFSFLLSVPSILAAGIYELYAEREVLFDTNLAGTAIATVVSFGVGYASIALLLQIIQRQGIAIFVAYRILLGVALLAAVAAGKLPAVEPDAPTTARLPHVSPIERA
ncbi:MAG: undecaprenyl-diphosphatase UppP [Fimbriimonadaceae bacterium]|nr:undecaprenyl-diphosphatase UppP [Fimbriimonadaceae bacterium]